MAVDALISTLGYRDSPSFLSGDGLEDILGLSHIFRRAKQKCSLRGDYTLKEQSEDANETRDPLDYGGEAYDEADSQPVTQRVWNRNGVPFIIVPTPHIVDL